MSINLIHYYNNSRIRAFWFRSHVLLLLSSICCFYDYQSWLSAGGIFVSRFWYGNTLLISFFAMLLNKHFVRLDFTLFCLVQRVQQNGAKNCNLQNKTPTNRHVVLMCIIPGRNTMFCVNQISMNTKIILS